MNFLKKVDPEIYTLVKKEEKRQQETLMMIPSENIASAAVEEAMGTVLGNKYGEGYPNKRYYQGNQVIDILENTVIDRVKKLFRVEAANVQPHSGSPANFAVYTALMEPGDTLTGLELASGGHLTHGAPYNASSKYFRSAQYTVERNGWIDYKKLRALAKAEKPKVIVASTTAYARILEWKTFAEIADEVGAYLMADISHLAGLIAAGVYPSPVPYVHIVTTTTHKTLRGPRGAIIMVTAKGLKKDPDLAKKIDKTIIPGIQGGPHFNTIAAIGVALKEASTARFKTYAKQVLKNAKTLEIEFKKYDFDLVTGGTDCHLLLIDTRNKHLLGNTIAEGCDAANIILNRNWVPYDVGSAFFPSGIRLGTPGTTSRGMKEKQMKLIAGWISQIVTELEKTKIKMGITDEQERKRSIRQDIIEATPVLKEVKKKVATLCKRFPVKRVY